jgi:arsenate reductase (glutaredoxin)
MPPKTSKTVTIYHNPKCGTSRKVLEALRAKGIEPSIVPYVDQPPSKTKLKELLAKMGAKPRDILRRKGTPYEELGLDDPEITDARLIELMVEHPILIERPIVETATKAVLARPPERVDEIL